MDTPATMDELKTWLAELNPIPRARLLGLVTDARHLSELGAIRRAAVYEATREATAAAVAAELGVSAKSVSKAVGEHKKTLAE